MTLLKQILTVFVLQKGHCEYYRKSLHIVKIWLFLKLPTFKTKMYSIGTQTTAAVNSIQRQKSQCSMSSPIRFPSLFGAPPILQTLCSNLTVDQ